MNDILKLINDRRPITLDLLSKDGPFPDDHEFVIQLPGWVFRKARSMYEQEGNPSIDPRDTGTAHDST